MTDVEYHGDGRMINITGVEIDGAKFKRLRHYTTGSARSKWYHRWTWRLAGFVAAIIGAVIAGYILHWFGWNS